VGVQSKLSVTRFEVFRDGWEEFLKVLVHFKLDGTVRSRAVTDSELHCSILQDEGMQKVVFNGQ